MSLIFSTGPELIHETEMSRESDDRNLQAPGPADRTIGRTAEDGDIYIPHDLADDFWERVDAAMDEWKDQQ